MFFFSLFMLSKIAICENDVWTSYGPRRLSLFLYYFPLPWFIMLDPSSVKSWTPQVWKVGPITKLKPSSVKSWTHHQVWKVGPLKCEKLDPSSVKSWTHHQVEALKCEKLDPSPSVKSWTPQVWKVGPLKCEKLGPSSVESWTHHQVEALKCEKLDPSSVKSWAIIQIYNLTIL